LKIQVIGSSSSGNCYLIDDGRTKLLLECGLPIRKIKEGCDYDLSGIAGCLVTHEHGDHAQAAADLMKAGVDVWMTEGTARAIHAPTYRLKLWRPYGEDPTGQHPLYSAEMVGMFKVRPFAVHHDAAEPVGYLVQSLKTHEKLLFVTDTQYINYHFSGLTHIMVEANFSAETLSDPDNDPRRHRLRRAHMSLETCLALLHANDLSQVREIWLIHLSQSNGEPEEFKRRVQEATGCEVYVA
jgi:phosphoribosyl 1,2-cyclic phosphodiesterase